MAFKTLCILASLALGAYGLPQFGAGGGTVAGPGGAFGAHGAHGADAGSYYEFEQARNLGFGKLRDFDQMQAFEQLQKFDQQQAQQQSFEHQQGHNQATRDGYQRRGY